MRPLLLYAPFTSPASFRELNGPACLPPEKGYGAETANKTEMPTIPAPKTRIDRVLTALPLYDILIALFVLIGGIVAGLLLLQGPGHLRIVGGGVSIVAAIAIAVFNIIKASLQWRQKNVKESPHELEGCLYTLHDILNLSVPVAQPDPGLRITVHVLSGDGRYLVQALGYVGSQRKKATAGRQTPISCGITGKAYRLKEAVRLQRASDNYEEYIRELVEHQGFTEDQARSVDSATMSGYAVPLFFADGSEAGIVYADAVERSFFSDERVSIINRACVGIARFIERKYAV